MSKQRKYKWQVVNVNGYVTAKYGRYMFKCCSPKIAPSDWVYIKEINMCISNRCRNI